MKEYVVTIDYDNMGKVCQYYYCERAVNMKQALDEAMNEFRNFMKINHKAVEILEINGFIHNDPDEDLLNDDEYSEMLEALYE